MTTPLKEFPKNPRQDQTKVIRLSKIGSENLNNFVAEAKKLNWHLMLVSNVRVHFVFGEPEIEYTATCGEHIDTSIKNACALAVNKNKNVFFNFNDDTIRVTPNSDVQEIKREREERLIKKQKEYESSDEFKNIKIKAELDLASTQIQIGSLINLLLNDKVVTLDELMKWLKKFADVADRIGVTYNKTELIDWFTKNGYVMGYGVGQPPEFFETKERLGRYIVGQAMSCLNSGMGPHPVTINFVDKYFTLKN
jgi:hypothetical protein